ncbi:TIGR03086 family metal-binding protein [Amycolatopsis suaedae]|uniref:TIGR03086 family protein n=1 Tax=Amycolatopsis suaedae TaxID=2510978 RepID=A0A4Q7IXI4_9PSEU|nr:TIGR03086 family metal-binding protein [Amycolatopsis suaedae]RZQ59650.1 TIGR03086 family protein [Amycolatopsis suaedae]
MSRPDTAVKLFHTASSGFESRLRRIRPSQWSAATPCAAWDVRQLVNHVTRGNLNYVGLLDGATSADFLRLRDADALGADPVGAYRRSVRMCAEAFGRPGALEQVLDYPLGRLPGRQAIAVRTTDTVVHTWDLARALGVDDRLDPGLVAWIGEHLDEIYAGLPETPVSPDTTHRFFAAPSGGSAGTPQDELLRLMGRNTGRPN